MKGLFRNSLFSNKNFSLFFSGQSLSAIGDGFQQLALIYLIFSMGGSGGEMALSQFFLIFPRIIILTIGGVIVDRFNAKQVLWISDFFRMLIMTGIIVFIVSNSLSFPLLYLLLTFSGIASGFFYPAFNSIVPSVVEAKDLEKANAWVQSISQIAIFIGPPLAGLIIANFGIEVGFIVNTISYAIATVSCLLMRINKETTKEPMDSKVIEDLLEGFKNVWKEKWLGTILIVDLIGGLAVVGPMQIALPIYSEGVLGVDPSQMGIIVSSFGIGSVLGMMIVSKLKAKYKTLHSFYVLEILQGVFLLFVAFPFLPMVLLALGLVGILNGISSVIMISKIQEYIPMNRLGRTMSIVSLASYGAVPISQLLTGWLTEEITPSYIFVAASLLLFLSGLIGLRISIKLNKVYKRRKEVI